MKPTCLRGVFGAAFVGHSRDAGRSAIHGSNDQSIQETLCWKQKEKQDETVVLRGRRGVRLDRH